LKPILRVRTPYTLNRGGISPHNLTPN